jgi:hypothetical protein
MSDLGGHALAAVLIFFMDFVRYTYSQLGTYVAVFLGAPFLFSQRRIKSRNGPGSLSLSTQI